MKKIKFAVATLSLLSLAGCNAGGWERTLLVKVSDKTLTNDGFDAVTDFTGASILFAEISFDFHIEIEKPPFDEDDSKTLEEHQSELQSIRKANKEYFTAKNQEMVDKYSLISFCDHLEVDSYTPSVELIYLDGKISESELNRLNLVLKDEHTVSVDFYTD